MFSFNCVVSPPKPDNAAVLAVSSGSGATLAGVAYENNGSFGTAIVWRKGRFEKGIVGNIAIRIRFAGQNGRGRNRTAAAQVVVAVIHQIAVGGSTPFFIAAIYIVVYGIHFGANSGYI